MAVNKNVNYVFFALKVHAIFLTPGLLERGDVRHIRAAETGHDGGQSQRLNYSIIIVV